MAASEDGVRDAERPGWPPSRLALLQAVFRKQLVLLVRYPINTSMHFLTLLVLFGVVLFGGEAVVGTAITDSLDGIIVGFFVWMLALVAFSDLAWNVIREAQWGTLERLFLSPNGFGVVMLVKMLVNVLLSFAWSLLFLLVMMALSGRWLAVDPLTVLPLGLLTVASVAGIGFCFAGLALLYKRIENVFQLVQLGLIGLVAAPVDTNSWLKLLPISHGSFLMQRAMEDGVRLWQFEQAELGLLVLTSGVYLIAGFYVLHRSQGRARRAGVLGQY